MVRRGAIRIACALLIAVGPAQAALGQARPRAAPAPATARPAAPAAVNLPAPDRLTSLKMLWSMMAAVDHANRTGNYSVLRDLGSAAFQSRNNPANLAAIFAGLRERNVDLADTLVVTPNWDIAPTLIQPQVLRMRGSFPLRPAAIAFDLLFTWDQGWRLDAIAVQALPGAG
jgi:hypothetical protein